jgi:hypothetical protein
MLLSDDELNAMQVEIDDWKARALKAEQSTIPPWRGYALLGTGNYVINHTADFDPELGAELIITIATDDDRSGNRQVGESRDNDPNKLPIQAADMAIRIGFLNERGLFALEDQLRMLRSVHFPDATPPQPAAQERETCTWTEQDDKDMPGTYASSCGEMWSFIDGGVKENRVTYCHHCGGKVVLAASPQEQQP